MAAEGGVHDAVAQVNDEEVSKEVVVRPLPYLRWPDICVHIHLVRVKVRSRIRVATPGWPTRKRL